MERIYRHRASVVCVDKGRLLVCHFRDPFDQREFLTPPGGGIDDGETAVEAAFRETLEETGYSVSIDKASHLTGRYDFLWNGRIYDCETEWFLGSLESDLAQEVDDAPYNLSTLWLDLKDVSTALSYNKSILKSVNQLLTFIV